jgi:hydrogenase maturation factor
MPKIIRHHNDPNFAVTLNGDRVERTQNMYLPSRHEVLPVMQTSMHFLFRDPTVPRGTTLFCTCGAAGIIIGYQAYKHLTSYMGNEVIACHHLITYGNHADGSHE